jgi:hypothetical protein
MFAVLICLALAVGAVIGFSFFKNSQQLSQALQASTQYAQADAEVIERLGTPISEISLHAGRDSIFDTTRPVHITLSLKGPKAEGVVKGDARHVGDKWKFEGFTLLVAGQKEPIELSTKESE